MQTDGDHEMDLIVVRPRMSAEALNITQVEHDALIDVRDNVLPVLVHDRDVIIPAGHEIDGKNKGLNMSIVLDEESCGTTACIAGWMYVSMSEHGVKPDGNAFAYGTHLRSPALAPLFMPMTDREGRDLLDEYGLPFDFPYEHIDVDIVKSAIDNFLTTGNPDYPALLSVE